VKHDRDPSSTLATSFTPCRGRWSCPCPRKNAVNGWRWQSLPERIHLLPFLTRISLLLLHLSVFYFLFIFPGTKREKLERVKRRLFLSVRQERIHGGRAGKQAVLSTGPFQTPDHSRFKTDLFNKRIKLYLMNWKLRFCDCRS